MTMIMKVEFAIPRPSGGRRVENDISHCITITSIVTAG